MVALIARPPKISCPPPPRVALIAVLPLLRTSWRLYGPAPDFEGVERDLEQRRQRSREYGRGRHRSGRYRR